VDGSVGRLVYRGYLIKDLAGKASFEEVVHLLLNETLPTRDQLKSFAAQLAAERAVTSYRLACPCSPITTQRLTILPEKPPTVRH
jgi:citrate synthase